LCLSFLACHPIPPLYMGFETYWGWGGVPFDH
jgi:hypothetical protein